MAGKLVNRSAGTLSHAELIRQTLERDGSNVLSDLQFISEEKLAAYLRIAKLAIFPYRSFESQSGAASAAAGRGVPIVTTGVGGLKELAINGEFVARDLGMATLATLLGNLLSGYDADYPKMQISQAEKFSWESAAMIHAQLYAQS